VVTSAASSGRSLQGSHHRAELLLLEEPGPHVPLLEPPDDERGHEPVLMAGERRHARETGELPVDAARLRARRPAGRLVGLDDAGREPREPRRRAEVGDEMRDQAFDRPQRLAAVQDVILADQLRRRLEGQPVGGHGHRDVEGDLALALPQERAGLRLRRGLRGLPDRLPVLPEADPPHLTLLNHAMPVAVFRLIDAAHSRLSLSVQKFGDPGDAVRYRSEREDARLSPRSGSVAGGHRSPGPVPRGTGPAPGVRDRGGYPDARTGGPQASRSPFVRIVRPGLAARLLAKVAANPGGRLSRSWPSRPRFASRRGRGNWMGRP
jgi:hypothetical protein